MRRGPLREEREKWGRDGFVGVKKGKQTYRQILYYIVKSVIRKEYGDSFQLKKTASTGVHWPLLSNL